MEKIEDLTRRLHNYYCDTKDPSKENKLTRIRKGMKYGNYNLQAIFDEVTEGNYFNKFPSWSQVQDIIHKHAIQVQTFENTDNERHEIDGLWVCSLCFGQQHRKHIINGYEVVTPCEQCEGVGQKLGKNIFKPFVKNEKSFSQMFAELAD